MSTPDYNLEELDQLWHLRHEKRAIEELEALLHKALLAQAREYSLLWRAARMYHFRAMQVDESENQQQKKQQVIEYYSQGAACAREAMELDRGGIEGFFWRGVNEIEAARRTSTLAAFTTLSKATSFIQGAANMDESYHFAGPLRVLGRIIHRKPLLLGGSANIAIDYFRRALELCPDNSTTQLYLIEALLTEQQKPEARRLLNGIIAAPNNADWMWEQARDRKIAQQLLQTL